MRLNIQLVIRSSVGSSALVCIEDLYLVLKHNLCVIECVSQKAMLSLFGLNFGSRLGIVSLNLEVVRTKCLDEPDL